MNPVPVLLTAFGGELVSRLRAFPANALPPYIYMTLDLKAIRFSDFAVEDSWRAIPKCAFERRGTIEHEGQRVVEYRLVSMG